MSLACAACDPPPEELCPTSLVDHFRWTLLPEEGDTGPKGPCTRNDVTAEFFGQTPSFSVDTTDCSVATVEQPILLSAEANETMHIRLYHYALTTSTAGEGVVSVSLGGRELWTEQVSLPSEDETLETDVVLPEAAPAGTPIRWRVQNHGDNSWNLIDLTVMDVCPEAQ